MRLSDFRALSFDCYGTLVDWAPGILAALAPWRERAGVAPDEALAAFGELEPERQAAAPTSPYPEILAAVARDLGERFAAPVSDEEAEAFGRSIGDWPPFPDTVAALDHLGERFALVVLSNVDRASFERTRARLGTRFDHVITAEDVGSYKPDRRNFEALLAACEERGWGAPLHVAESLFHDHQPAKALGLSTVWIDRAGPGATRSPGDALQPDRTFPSLAAMVEAIDGEAEA